MTILIEHFDSPQSLSLTVFEILFAWQLSSVNTCQISNFYWKTDENWNVYLKTCSDLNTVLFLMSYKVFPARFRHVSIRQLFGPLGYYYTSDICLLFVFFAVSWFPTEPNYKNRTKAHGLARRSRARLLNPPIFHIHIFLSPLSEKTKITCLQGSTVSVIITLIKKRRFVYQLVI